MRKLGRLPCDPAKIARAPSLYGHRMASLPPPPRLIRDHIAYQPQMFANNTLGDCTCAGLANAALAAATLDGFGLSIPDDKVVALYSAACGYNPADPSTDQGGVELDVLGYQLTNGFDIGGQTPLVGDFATFDPQDRALFANAMVRCGTVYLGLNLSIADQTTNTWDTNYSASAGDSTPGGWGGHCGLAWSYTGLADDDLVTLVTWGSLTWKATWRWLADRQRCQEAHVVIWRQLMKANGLNQTGLDYDQLRADNMAWAV